MRFTCVVLCLCIPMIFTEVTSLGDTQFSGLLEQLREAQQSDRFNQILQNVTSGIVSQLFQNIQTELQEFISNRTSGRITNNDVLTNVVQTFVSTLQSQVINRSESDSVLDNGLQNISSDLVSQLTTVLRNQLQELITSDNFTLNGTIDEIFQSFLSGVVDQIRESKTQLQTYVSKFIIENVPSYLVQLVRSTALNDTFGDFLSSQQFEELIQRLFVGIVTGAQNSTLITDLLETIATGGSPSAVIETLVKLLRETVNGIGAETVQNLMRSVLTGNDFQIAVQQLLANLNDDTVSGVMNGAVAALLSMPTGDIAGINTAVQDLLPNLPASLSSDIAQALVSSIIGNQGNILEQLASLNISEILEIFTDGNIRSNVNALVDLLQNSSIVQDSVVVLTGLIENSARAALKSNGVSEACQDGVQRMIEGIMSQEQWAVNMLDASWKIPSDLRGTLGTWKFVGSYDECVRITATTSEGAKAFDGKYCRTLVNIAGFPSVPGQRAPLTLGYCVPDTCKTRDVSGVLTTAESLLGNVTLPITWETECEDGDSIGHDAVIVICILVVLAVFIVIGTLYDVLAFQMGVCKSTQKQQFSDGVVNQGYVITDGVTIEKIRSADSISKVTVDMLKDNADTIDIEATDSNGTGVQGDENAAGSGSKHEVPKLIKISEIEGQRERSVFEKIWLSFSVYTNGSKILNTEQGAGTLGAVNGIRFLSMAWVILGHTYYFATGYSRNFLSHFSTKLNQWSFMSIAYSTVSVDSFFAISGILVAYLTLKELKKVNGARHFNWALFYVHRFWRLTPPYMLVLMVGTVLLPYITSGPMWRYGEDLPLMQNCRTYWWTNLLYVNNLVHSKDICMGWTWYLSNDLQFYAISPLVLLPLFYHAAVGIGSCLLFLAGTIAAAAIVTYKHEYHVQQFLPYTPAPKDDDEMINLYFPCYNRMGPYIIGLFTGYLLYRWKCRCQIPKIANITLWLLSLGICCAVVYGPYSDGDDHVMTRNESAAFEGLHRTGWGMAVCWIVFACACGHGGWINQILSWKAFIPLGRLTYCAYLVHPLVMMVFLNGRRQPSYFSDYEVVYMFIGHLVLSYGVAFLVSLAFEAPMMGIEKALIRKKR